MALPDPIGAQPSVVEAVGTQESMMQAIRSSRPGGHVGFVGIGHGVALPAMDLFWSMVHLHGGPAPVRRFLPALIDLIWKREIDPGKVFDLELPPHRAAEGYEAMDQRHAVKVLLHTWLRETTQRNREGGCDESRREPRGQGGVRDGCGERHRYA